MRDGDWRSWSIKNVAKTSGEKHFAIGWHIMDDIHEDIDGLQHHAAILRALLSRAIERERLSVFVRRSLQLSDMLSGTGRSSAGK